MHVLFCGYIFTPSASATKPSRWRFMGDEPMQFPTSPAPTVPAGLIAQAILSTVERERVLFDSAAISLHEWPSQITLTRGEYAEVAQ